MKKISMICISLCLLIFCSIALTACTEQQLFDKFGAEIPEEFKTTNIKRVFSANNQGGMQGDGDHYVVYKIKNPPTEIPSGFKKPDEEIEYRKQSIISAITPSTCGYKYYLRVPEKYRPDWDKDFYWQHKGLHPSHPVYGEIPPYTRYGDNLFVIYQPHTQYLFILARLT